MAQLAMLGGGMGGPMSLMLPLFSSVIGMFMQPGQKEEQGKLNDLKVSTSAYGQGIAIVYGTMRVPGNMFWATQFEEKKRYINSKGKDVSGKKKGDKKGKPVYEYYANFAMGLCAGPVGEILRIWADSNLIYDKYNPNNEDLVGPGFSNADGGGAGKMGKGAGTGKKGGSQESGRFHFRFYPGDETQMPDPHMGGKNSDAGQRTPAHRGLAYLYFERFALADFGNRTPTITAEVTTKHVRKPIFTYYTSLEKQGKAVDAPPGGAFAQMFFDPVRLKVYTVSQGILRQWDVESRKETKRIRVADIRGEAVPQVQHPQRILMGQYYMGERILFNGLGSNFPTSMEPMQAGYVVGIAASGDIIVSQGATNTRPIMFVDPESMTIKSRFGRFGNALSATDVSLVAAEHSTIIGAFDIIKKAPVYYTAVVSTFGDIYFFNDKNEPMNYWSFGGSILDNTGIQLAPGLPSTSGTTFFTSNAKSLFDLRPAIEVVRWEARNDLAINNPLPHPIIGTQLDASQFHWKYYYGMESVPQKRRVIYESIPEDDETGRTISQMYPISGSEAVCFLEFVYGNTVHPEKNGVYAVKIDYAENEKGEFEVLWRHKFDEATSLGFNASRESIALTGHRLIYRRSNDLVWDIDFSLEKVDMWYLPGNIPSNSGTQMYISAKGALLSEWNFTPEDVSGVAGSTVLVEAALDRMTQQKITAADILHDLAERVGIGRERMDTTMLNEDVVTGYVVQQPRAARGVADDLMKIFFFDIAESDYRLKAVSRNQSVVRETIYQNDLGFVDGGTPGDNPSDFYKETRVQEIDLPQVTMITYIDPKDDYESGEQHWRRPRSSMPVMQSREKLDLNFPMAMEADFAKQMAQKITYSAWSERAQYEMTLPWKFLKYDPTDVLRFQMRDGLMFQARMSSMDVGQDFSIRLHGVATEMASYNSSVKAQGNGAVVPVPSHLPPFIRAEVFDLPYFEDVDQVGDTGAQYYWGLKAYGPGFRFGTLSSKLLPNGQWDSLGATAFDMPWGTALGYLRNPPWGSAWATDDVSRINLMPAFDFELNDGMYEWSSIADDQWPSNENCVIIGNEIIYFKNVAVNPDGTVTIFNLIRGARGTINAAYSHLPGEDFYLLTSAIQDEIMPFQNVGMDMAFRPAAPSVWLGGLPSIQTNMKGASHRPWAPNMIKRSLVGGNIVFTWERSTRLAGSLLDGTGTVPQLEGPEEYEFYVLNGPYVPKAFNPDDPTTYKRKFGPLGVKTVTYTAAEMGTDGLGPQLPIHVAVLQRNQFVGRGFPGWTMSFPGY